MIDAPIRAPLEDGAWPKVWAAFFQVVVALLRKFENGVFYQCIEVTSDYTIQLNDCAILVDATIGPVTVTLLDPALCLGKRLTIKKIDNTANAMTIAAPLGSFIDGSATQSTTTYNASFDLIPFSLYWFLA